MTVIRRDDLLPTLPETISLHVFEVEWAAAGSTGPPLSSATTSTVLFVSRAGSCRATNTPSSLVASPSQPWVL